MAVSSKYTQDLSVQIVFFTFSCKWFLCFYFWALIWSFIVDLFASLYELASASVRTLLKLTSVRALLKPYGDTLKTGFCGENLEIKGLMPHLLIHVKSPDSSVEGMYFPQPANNISTLIISAPAAFQAPLLYFGSGAT